ncbi:MAG: NADH-quinone oxidoreductase subunit M [Nitrospinae bacterium]|nr:NADH-quinone oxidoreductase subunit M [Nitrospinota bacterium]
MESIVSWLIFLPILCGIGLFYANIKEDDFYRSSGLAVSVGVFFISLALLGGDYEAGGFVFVQHFQWIPQLGVNYLVGVDGISLYLVLLTTIIFPIAFLSMQNIVKERVKEFVALLLILEGGIIGVFVSLDLVLFYVFWEVMLIPSYFLIGLWAEKDKFYTAIKFVVYTLVGSLLFLVAIIIIGVVHFKQTGTLTFNLIELQNTVFGDRLQYMLFAFFALAFCIKIPLFPLHSWMPHAYIKSSIPMVIVLTGIMSKTGLYGLMRFNFTLFPSISHEVSGLFLVLAMAGIIYGAWCAIGQDDVKGIAAYSSLSHLSFVLLGMFAFNSIGESSAVLQMFNHGIVSAGIFFYVGLIEERVGDRKLSSVKMLSSNAPILSGFFFVIVLAALGLPGLNNFVGEFLLLLGLWTTEAVSFAPMVVYISVVAIVFASIYMLFMYQGLMYEKPEGTATEIPEIKGKELSAIIPICFFIIYIGLYPASLTNTINASTDKLVTSIHKEIKVSENKE